MYMKATSKKTIEPFCQMCVYEKHNVAIKIKHTCKNIPKTRKAKGMVPEYWKTKSDGTYVKVYVTECKFDTGKATLWRLAVQYINNQFVISGTETWFKNTEHLVGETMLKDKFIWVKKERYETLIFV